MASVFSTTIPRPKESDGEVSVWRRGLTHSALWFPLLAVVWFIVGLELYAYISVRLIVLCWEWLRHRGLRAKLRDATTRAEWVAIGSRLDREQGKDEWRATAASRSYDSELILRLTHELEVAREAGATGQLMRNLAAAVVQNVGGFENEELYSRTFVSTKDAVQDFVDEVVRSADWLAEQPSSPAIEELSLSVARAWGRTALCLSGGGAMALPHIGVVKALIEAHVLPDVISGTSCGSMVASMLCVRTDDEFVEAVSRSDELERRLCFLEDSVPTMVRRFLQHGHFIDERKWVARLLWITNGATTFAEAFARTGRVLNITVTNSSFGRSSHNAQILNYVTTPNVVIYSATLASAAMPLLSGPVQLLEKVPSTGEIVPFHDLASTRWRDGSLSIDIPLAALAQLFDVKFTIVSQCNPHVAPFFFWPRGAAGSPSLHRQGFGWRGGFLFAGIESVLKLDMIKWLTLLKSLDLMPHIGGQDWSNLFLQTFFGSVTILPRQTLLSFLHVASNPTKEWWDWYRLEGERATWPRLGMISNHMVIEQAIRRLVVHHHAAGVELFVPDRTHIHPQTPAAL